MSRAYVDIWDWIWRFHQAALQAGDQPRVRLVELFLRHGVDFEADAAAALAVFNEGLALAKQLNEPCMVLFYTYWCWEMHTFFLGQVTQGLDLATRTVVEARKPPYHACPMRAQAFYTMMYAHILIDPFGYQDQITEMLDYIEDAMPLDQGTHWLLMEARAYLAFRLGDFSAAQDHLDRYQAEAQQAFRQADGYSLRAELAYHAGDYRQMVECGLLVEYFARLSNRKALLAQGIAWQALFARQQGQQDEARLYFRRAVAIMAPLRRQTGDDYFDILYAVLCRFHALGGAPEKALGLRNQQIAQLTGTGEFHAEALAHLARLRLLRQLAQMTPAHLEAARQVGQTLRKPDWFHAALAEILES